MAKFCTKCGKPLVDGKPCSCSLEKEEQEEKLEEQEEKVEEESKIKIIKNDNEDHEERVRKVKHDDEEDEDDEDEEESSTNEIVSAIVDIYKNIWKKPVTTMKKYSEKNVKLSLCLVLINILIFGLTYYFIANNTISGVVSDITTKLTSILTIGGTDVENLLGISSDELVNFQAFKLPFMSTFLYMSLIVLIANVIYLTISWLFMGIIFKGNKEYSHYLTTIAVSSPLASIVMVIALIVSFISYKIALLLMLAATIVFFVSVTHNFIEQESSKKEKLCYSQMLSVVLATVLTSVAVVIIGSVGIYNYTSSFFNNYATSSSTTTTTSSSLFE